MASSMACPAYSDTLLVLQPTVHAHDFRHVPCTVLPSCTPFPDLFDPDKQHILPARLAKPPGLVCPHASHA